jgi:hypothetical protein
MKKYVHPGIFRFVFVNRDTDLDSIGHFSTYQSVYTTRPNNPVGLVWDSSVQEIEFFSNDVWVSKHFEYFFPSSNSLR